MSLSDIANEAADPAAADAAVREADLQGRTQLLLRVLQARFEDPALKAIEQHLKNSGFKVRHESDSSGVPEKKPHHGDTVYAQTAVVFEKNGVECRVGARHFGGRDPSFYFSRCDDVNVEDSQPIRKETDITTIAHAIPLIQDCIMDNLPKITEPTIGSYVRRWVPSSLKL